MERFSQRERVLLGYSPGTRAFSPTKELDIDFNDVFGGPPRRSLTQDMRHSFNESMKYTNNSLVELEDANPRSGLGERPVFGEETLNRRKHPSDDFYDDIFRGDESISSPRRTSPFASTPGSRVLSPARPLPPRADPSGSSLPAQIQFSLPAILSRGMEFPAFASSNHSPYKNKEPISSGKGFQYTPSSFLSRHSNEPFQEEDALRNEIRPSYRPSPLSHDISLSSKVPSQPTKYDEPESPEIPSNLKKDTKSTGSPNNDAQFHFSIYKWASKGVPVLMPLRGLNSTKSKDTVKLERCSSFSGRIRREKMASGSQTPNMHSISATNKSPYTEDRKQDRSSPPKTRAKDIIEPCHIVEEAILSMEGSKSKDTVKFERCSSFNGRIRREKMASGSQTPNMHNISGTNESPYTEDRKQDRSSPPKTSTKDIIEPCHIVEEAVLSMEGSKSKDLTSHIVEAISVSPVTSNKREGMKTHSLSAFVSRERTEIGIAQPKEDEYKLELKSLHSFLNDAAEGQGNDKSTRKSGGKDSRAKDSRAKKMTASDLNADFSKKLKKRDEKKINPVNVEEIQMKEPHPQDLKSPSGDNLAQSGVKGKVKDFVKIFNQEADLKPKIDIKTQSQSSRSGIASFLGKDKEDTANASETNGDHVHNNKHTPANASVMSDKNIKKQEKHQPQLETSVLDANETFVGQKDAQESTSETLLDRTEFTVGDMDDLFHENFTIEELSNDQDKPSQNEDNCEDIETSDARIRKWSNGKEGNIRSLLSTLQYVLWPGSGWKTVPLVDIIEGSAVKRAYQKALLCLHPDKLQQKGAAAHQKYIAEKVFDILQEAWDQFNSLGLI